MLTVLKGIPTPSLLNTGIIGSLQIGFQITAWQPTDKYDHCYSILKDCVLMIVKIILGTGDENSILSIADKKMVSWTSRN